MRCPLLTRCLRFAGLLFTGFSVPNLLTDVCRHGGWGWCAENGWSNPVQLVTSRVRKDRRSRGSERGVGSHHLAQGDAADDDVDRGIEVQCWPCRHYFQLHTVHTLMYRSETDLSQHSPSVRAVRHTYTKQSWHKSNNLKIPTTKKK
jgi:hypothetical protein